MHCGSVTEFWVDQDKGEFADMHRYVGFQSAL